MFFFKLARLQGMNKSFFSPQEYKIVLSNRVKVSRIQEKKALLTCSLDSNFITLHFIGLSFYYRISPFVIYFFPVSEAIILFILI